MFYIINLYIKSETNFITIYVLKKKETNTIIILQL